MAGKNDRAIRTEVVVRVMAKSLSDRSGFSEGAQTGVCWKSKWDVPLGMGGGKESRR